MSTNTQHSFQALIILTDTTPDLRMMMPATVAGPISLLQRDHAKPRASLVGLSAILSICGLYHDFAIWWVSFPEQKWVNFSERRRLEETYRAFKRRVNQ